MRTTTPIFSNKLFKLNVKSKYRKTVVPSTFLSEYSGSQGLVGSLGSYMDYGRVDLVYSKFVILTFKKGLNYHVLASLYATLSRRRLAFVSMFLSNQDRTFFFNLLATLKKKGYYAVVVDKKYNKNAVKAMIQHKVIFFIDFSFSSRGGFFLIAGLATSLLHFALIKKYFYQHSLAQSCYSKIRK